MEPKRSVHILANTRRAINEIDKRKGVTFGQKVNDLLLSIKEIRDFVITKDNQCQLNGKLYKGARWGGERIVGIYQSMRTNKWYVGETGFPTSRNHSPYPLLGCKSFETKEDAMMALERYAKTKKLEPL